MKRKVKGGKMDEERYSEKDTQRYTVHGEIEKQSDKLQRKRKETIGQEER